MLLIFLQVHAHTLTTNTNSIKQKSAKKVLNHGYQYFASYVFVYTNSAKYWQL